DIRVGVDLPVRVVERDADVFAAVLEREYLLHAGKRAEVRCTVGPGLDHGARATDSLRAEAARAFWAEAHDLAPPDGRARAAETGRVEIVEVTRRILGYGRLARRV